MMGVLKAMIQHFGDRFDIDPALIAAMVMVESSGKAYRARYEPEVSDNYLVDVKGHALRLGITASTERIQQRTSWGLLQVMGFTARDDGFTGLLPELCLQEVGLEWGCKHLKLLQKRFGVRPGLRLEWDEPTVAAYNAGSPRKDKDGRWENVGYVTKVQRQYQALWEQYG